MPNFTYTRTYLKNRVNAGIYGKIGMLIDPDETINLGVREVHKDVKMRGMKRQIALTPNLFSGIYDYALPADIDGTSFIDLVPQVMRADGSFVALTSEQFDMQKAFETGVVTLDEYNGVPIMRISSALDSFGVDISDLGSLSTWTAFGDATNVAADTTNFIQGYGSITFDINAAGGTTAGIVNSALTTFDVSQYLGGTGAIFVWAYINDTTGVTSYTLRIGNNSSNYYSKTATVRSDGTSFQAGWNLLRFDLSNLTTVGSVSNTSMIYSALYMNKTISKISTTGYKFDWMGLKKGSYYNIKYYTQYGWIDSATSAYKQDSTSDLDILVAHPDEFAIILKKCIEMASMEVREYVAQSSFRGKPIPTPYMNDVSQYRLNYPDESKPLSVEYYQFGTTPRRPVIIYP